ncbi:hypothetical protein FG386_003406 [Cryptosporidium ryanae]|uniref:uncharacterized protein n=1 Tax=Cryptosporidium ryanae TaxID=515981 RepID=UPI003519E3DE|nr:hypothetical protein FG386_003406 [Cryptosporidium ryanae]
MDEGDCEKLGELFRASGVSTNVKRKKCWDLLKKHSLDKVSFNWNESSFKGGLKLMSIREKLDTDSDILLRNRISPYIDDNSITKWSMSIPEENLKKNNVKLGNQLKNGEFGVLDFIYNSEEPDFSNYMVFDDLFIEKNSSNKMKECSNKSKEYFTTGLSEYAKNNTGVVENYFNKENIGKNQSVNNNLLSCIERDSNKGSTKSRNQEAEDLFAALSIHGNIKLEHIEWVLSIRTEPKNFISETDVIGLKGIKKMLRDKIINPIQRPDLHIGLHSAPRGILLFGPPGTGKTMLAKWIASECKATFYDISPGSIMSKFYGETENIIKTLFMVSEYSSPSIIFIDEIDSIFSKRSSNADDNNIRIKNQFLQMIDGVQSDMSKIVVVVGATNRPDILDDAALRRLSKRVLVPLPDLESRVQQIQHILKNNSHGGCKLSEENLYLIAKEIDGWNGSDIKNLCIKAAEFSYDETIEKYNGIQNVPNTEAFRPINIKDFLDSLKLVKPSYSSENDMSTDLIKWSNLFGVT